MTYSVFCINLILWISIHLIQLAQIISANPIHTNIYINKIPKKSQPIPTKLITDSHIHKMLQFSKTSFTFEYTTDSHLLTTLTLINRNTTPIYYKFKVNRPRFYLVKPDRGLLRAGESVEINVKLHKDGIAQANADKFKCFWTGCPNDASEKQMDRFQQKLNSQQQKFLVHITNLPPGMDISKQRSNLASSYRNTQAMQSLTSHRNSSTNYENILNSRRSRVNELTNEIESIRKSLRDRKINEGPEKKKSGAVGLVGVVVIGVLLGIASSIWV